MADALAQRRGGATNQAAEVTTIVEQGAFGRTRVTVGVQDRQAWRTVGAQGGATLDPDMQRDEPPRPSTDMTSQARDVDRAEPRPDGQDRQEDQALPL